MFRSSVLTSIYAGTGYTLGLAVASPALAIGGTFATGYLINSLIIQEKLLPSIFGGLKDSTTDKISDIAVRFKKEKNAYKAELKLLQDEIAYLKQHPEQIEKGFVSKSANLALKTHLTIKDLHEEGRQISLKSAKIAENLVKEFKLSSNETWEMVARIFMTTFSSIAISTFLIQTSVASVATSIFLGAVFFTLSIPSMAISAALIILPPTLPLIMSRAGKYIENHPNYQI